MHRTYVERLGARRERRYGGFSGSDLGGAGRQPRPLFRAIHQSAETGDTEAAGLNQNGNPLPHPLGRGNSWNGG